MPKKFFLFIALAVTTTLVVSACERSAAQPMPILATPTAQGSNPVSQPTGISLVEAWGTSTAIYQQTAAAQGLLPVTATSTTAPVSNPTVTPLGFVPSATSLVPPTGGAPTATTNAAPVVVVATSTPGHPATYALQQGEWAYCIARRFNVNPDDLKALNGLTDAESTSLPPGYVLKIPPTGSFPGSRAWHPHPASYLVTSNDTIYGIACYFGDLDPTQIAAANSLSLTSALVPGRTLSIP